MKRCQASKFSAIYAEKKKCNKKASLCTFPAKVAYWFIHAGWKTKGVLGAYKEKQNEFQILLCETHEEEIKRTLMLMLNLKN
ncbi:MAG: hypothetical protein HYV52_00490 [Parcubacteria group bacterium]|nr:hypothetical protein [Parcubacteria group bacterium]